MPLHDVRPPVDWPTALWPWALLAVLLAAAVLTTAFFLFRKRRPAQPSAPPLSPRDKALKAIAALRQKGHLATGMFQPFYVELSGILRRYFEDQHNIRAPEMTTEEFLAHVQQGPLTVSLPTLPQAGPEAGPAAGLPQSALLAQGANGLAGLGPDLQRHREGLKAFLTSCDVVKFARHTPHLQEAEDNFRWVEELVTESVKSSKP